MPPPEREGEVRREVRLVNGNVIDDAWWDSDEGETYTVAASCTNCPWEGGYRKPKGYRRSHISECPNCGCCTVYTSSRAFSGEPR